MGDLQPSPLNIDDVFVILRNESEASPPNLPKKSAIKDCSVVYGLRDMNCVKCNAVHIVSEIWIEIAKLEYTTASEQHPNSKIHFPNVPSS